MNAQDDIPSAPEEGDERTGDQPPAAAVRQLIAGFAAVSRTGPSYHPIFDKFERDHVSQFLNQSHEQDQDERQFQRSNRWFRLAYALMGLGVFVFMTLLLLPEHAGLYVEILKGLGIFAAGAAGGYGLKAYRDESRA